MPTFPEFLRLALAAMWAAIVVPNAASDEIGSESHKSRRVLLYDYDDIRVDLRVADPTFAIKRNKLHVTLTNMSNVAVSIPVMADKHERPAFLLELCDHHGNLTAMTPMGAKRYGMDSREDLPTKLTALTVGDVLELEIDLPEIFELASTGAFVLRVGIALGGS